MNALAQIFIAAGVFFLLMAASMALVIYVIGKQE